MATSTRFSAFFFLVCAVCPAFAKPPSAEIAQRHQATIAEIKQLLAGPDSEERKFERLAKEFHGETESDYRRNLVALAAARPGSAQESFLIEVLRSDGDWTVRSDAAKTLGRTGSKVAIAPLAKAAAADAVTMGSVGCIGSEGTARRAAIFALAELARRVPESAKAIAEDIRKLPDANDADKRLINEQLGDARRQALFQLTGDRSLLAPYFEQLKSKDAKTRQEGVVAFRFLNLSKAPEELVALARDPSPDVRVWVVLVLGEIKDSKTIPLLMEIAKDAAIDRGARCNAIYSLGHIRAVEAKPLLESLLSDEGVKVNAAIALSEITGKRHPLVPEGYGGANWPGN
jgi:HEAT repeat protein